MAEREQIAVLRGRVSVREIARQLGRTASTVSCELRRNAPRGKVHLYRVNVAQSTADRRARRPTSGKLVSHPPLRAYVQAKLEGDERWSREQIARRLQLDFPDVERMRVCHETIYQALYVQGRKSRRRVDQRRERIKDKVLISERPTSPRRAGAVLRTVRPGPQRDTVAIS